MTLNRYIYARDNPMTLVDPAGKMYSYPVYPTGHAPPPPVIPTGPQPTLTQTQQNMLIAHMHAYTYAAATSPSTAIVGTVLPTPTSGFTRESLPPSELEGPPAPRSTTTTTTATTSTNPYAYGDNCGSLETPMPCSIGGAWLVVGSAMVFTGFVGAFSYLGGSGGGMYVASVGLAFTAGATIYNVETIGAGKQPTANGAFQAGVEYASEYVSSTYWALFFIPPWIP